MRQQELCDSEGRTQWQSPHTTILLFFTYLLSRPWQPGECWLALLQALCCELVRKKTKAWQKDIEVECQSCPDMETVLDKGGDAAPTSAAVC